MRINLRRHLAILLCVILLLALAPSGFAVDLEAPNEVIVNFVPSESNFADDLATADIQVDLYLLAKAVADGNDDSYTYEEILGENNTPSPFRVPLNALKDKLDERIEPGKTITQNDVYTTFEPLAQQFAAKALDINYNGPSPKSATPVAIDDGKKQTWVSVRDLTAGLYLLVIHGAGLVKSDDPVQGYVKSPSQTEGVAENILTTRVETESNEYLFKPQLLTVPTKIDTENENTQLYNTAYGDWEYTLSVYAKPTQVPKNGDLKIIKNLSQPGPDPVTFVFQVAWPKGNPTTTKVVSMTFAGGQAYEEYTLADTIPVGTDVEVTEVHSGIGYTAGVTSQTATIEVDPPATEDGASAEGGGIATVRFDNNHSGPGGGYGLLNRFTATETGAFEWTRYSDSADAGRPASVSDND